jgi:2'-5' RNA ligase
MRTFIAIEFPTTVQQALQHLCGELKRHLAAQKAPDCLRWAPVDNIHLTLRFLGDTTPAQAQIIATGLREVTANSAPFELTVGGVGAFPQLRQPRVLWLGVGGDLTQLHALQAAVEQTAQLAGFAAEERPFTAHITLARTQRSASREQLRTLGTHLATAGSPPQLSLRVDEIVHMRSDLQPRQAVYTPLVRLPLHPPLTYLFAPAVDAS